MPKQILLYGMIDSWSAMEFNECIQELQEEGPIDELTLRINTEGGSPEYGWGIISMFKDLDCVKKVKVDGQAHSMGAFILCYVNEAESLDVAEFLIHRAAYPEYFEASSYFTEPIKENLIRINKSLESAFRAKVDVAMFEEMKGVKVKDIFSMDSRIDVFLTAKEAKKIGLISKVTSLTAAAANEIKTYAKAASSNKKIFIPKIEAENNIIINNLKPNKMTVAEFKASNPEAFNEIVNEGIIAERDRVGSLLAFHDIDPKGIEDAIKEGKTLTSTMAAELTRKAVAKASVKGLEDDSAKNITTEDQGVSNENTDSNKTTEVEKTIEASIAFAKKQIK